MLIGEHHLRRVVSRFSILALVRVPPNGQHVVLGLQLWDMYTLHSSGKLTALPEFVPPASPPGYCRRFPLTLRSANKRYPSKSSW